MTTENVMRFPTPDPNRYVCSKCGVDAGCNCGAKPVPAWQRAAKAIAANPDKSTRELAAESGVSHMTVQRTRSVTNVTAGEKRKTGKGFMRIKGDHSLSAGCREIMRAGNGDLVESAKALGVSKNIYGKIKKIVMLADRSDLTAAQKLLASQALQMMDKERQVQQPFELIKPLSELVWGKTRNIISKDTERRRLDKFNRSIGAICGACAACDHITVPYLSKEDITFAVSDLTDAVASVERLIKAIKGVRQ